VGSGRNRKRHRLDCGGAARSAAISQSLSCRARPNPSCGTPSRDRTPALPRRTRA
jgi:hypothetical protein